MKYILICLAALVVCFGIGFLLAKIIFKKSNKKGVKTLLCTLAFGIVLMVLLTFGYMSIYYHGDETAEKALDGNETVNVQKIDGGYFFDGPGSDKALIFYPGAKVECEAYAGLMLKLADNGIDCFLADMPFNFALFGGNAADKFIGNYTYDTWLMAGHSMGGLVASSYAAGHSDVIDGIILLAAYPTSEVKDDMMMLSIYGTEDGCLDRAEYEKYRTNWSALADEVIIDGGNHAGFGNYGVQSGDGVALITAEKQQEKTVGAISDYFG